MRSAFLRDRKPKSVRRCVEKRATPLTTNLRVFEKDSGLIESPWTFNESTRLHLRETPHDIPNCTDYLFQGTDLCEILKNPWIVSHANFKFPSLFWKKVVLSQISLHFNRRNSRSMFNWKARHGFVILKWLTVRRVDYYKSDINTPGLICKEPWERWTFHR